MSDDVRPIVIKRIKKVAGGHHGGAWKIAYADSQSSQSTQIPSGLQIGTGVTPVATVTNFTEGALEQTSNPLDVAINGQGFFQVLLPDGTTAYTRDGSFQKDNQGQMVTASGYPLQPSITIPPNALTITIANDGVVSVTQSGSTATTQIGSLQVATFINNGGLQRVGENLYLETASSGTPTPTTPGTSSNASGATTSPKPPVTPTRSTQ